MSATLRTMDLNNGLLSALCRSALRPRIWAYPALALNGENVTGGGTATCCRHYVYVWGLLAAQWFGVWA